MIHASSAARVITLLTDFGTQDAYVGLMKGVLLAQARVPLQIVDLTHHLPPHDIRLAAETLAVSYSFFPSQTVHLVVVDPGVGSKRRILAGALQGQYFVGPDNGVLSLVFKKFTPDTLVSVESESFFRSPVSTTFHGRDIMAPVAAALASGVSLNALGPQVDAWVELSWPSALTQSSGDIIGEVVQVDHFGNAITNILIQDLPKRFKIVIQGQVVHNISHHFSEGKEGQLMALAGSRGALELAVNEGNAAQSFNLKRAMQVLVEAEIK